VGCGCNSVGRSAQAAGAGASAGGDSSTPGRRWEVVYPNGRSQEFTSEWQVAQALALTGGVSREIDPEAARTDGSDRQSSSP
jgi:hypothetical protein